MLDRSDSTVKQADYLVNLTDIEFQMYKDSTGELKSIKPSKQTSLPQKPHQEEECPKIYFVMKAEEAKKLKIGGRCLDDIAILKRVLKGGGRDHADLGKLVWAKSPKEITVRLF